MKSSTLQLLVVLLITGVANAQGTLPFFEQTACPFEGADDRDDVQCGYLAVAQNRDNADGRRLRLSVAVLKSLSDNPLPDPLVFLSGGPGGASVKHAMRRVRSSFWTRFRQERDIVFFDQRGTGFSDPEFCLELNFVYNTVSLKGLPEAEERALRIQALKECRETMIGEGIDFGSYNTATSALDLDELRSALGYAQWNLFGISYGTRLALAAMRDTPEGIRSVIIDSTWPLNAPVADDKQRLMRSLDLIFDQCAASVDCDTEFPTLEQDFFAMLDEFEEDPTVLEMSDLARFPDGHIVIDGNLLASGIFLGLYDRDFIRILPLLVSEVRRRNTDVLSALADGLVREAGFSYGLQLAINCYEWSSRRSPELVNADKVRYPQLHIWQPEFDIAEHCDAWQMERADRSQLQAVHSDIPTLIAAGEFDPITPPSYGRLTAETLTNSAYFEVPAAGHSASAFVACPEGIMEAFLDEPSGSVDTSCVAEIPSTRFTTGTYLSAGIYPLAKQLQGKPSVGRMASLGLILLLLLSTVIVWPLNRVVRRIRKRRAATPTGAGYARYIAAITSLIGLVYLGSLARVVLTTAQENPLLLGFGVPGSAAPIFILPWLMLLATIFTARYAVIAWTHQWWGFAGRAHYLLVTVACVGLVAWVFGLGLI
jgi:pimeloyl-ACP methyl ester carboxylesterase